MKKETWKRRIKEATIAAGTYRPCFDELINTLAGILEKRDDAEAEYKRRGSKPLVEYTNKGGNQNVAKNPALTLWNDMNTTALAYWRELGLTPAGLKKLKDDALREQTADFGSILRSISG